MKPQSIRLTEDQMKALDSASRSIPLSKQDLMRLCIQIGLPIVIEKLQPKTLNKPSK